VLQFLFLFLVVLRSILLRFVDCLSVVSVILFPLGDHTVVSGYLLSPSKSVLYLASWCVYFSRFLAIAGDNILITLDFLWCCGEYF
jgi:hypothetical protein